VLASSHPTFERALVLGASGMIGAHIVRSCLHRGIPTRALVRPSSDRRNLAGLALEVIEGDLRDADSIGRALDDCDLLLHAAAPYPRRHFGKARLIRDASDDMQRLLETFAHHRTASPRCRMVYVSSVTTIGIPTGPDPGPAKHAKPTPQAPSAPHTESAPQATRPPHSRPARETDTEPTVHDSAPYFELKQTLETMARRGAQEGADIVIVNPTFCIDAFDSNLTTAQLLLPLARRQLPAYLPGMLNAVPTRDVGEGVLLAAERGRRGERYILGNENLTSRALLERCAGIAGVAAPRHALPIPVAELLSMATELVAGMTGTRPLFPMTGIRMIKHGQAVDIRRAREELGYRTTSLDEAIRRAFDWYRQEGYL